MTAKADLNPGEEEGTTDIDINIREIVPFRVMATADNSGRDTAGRNRAGLLAAHDSLFGYHDKLSGGRNLHQDKIPEIKSDINYRHGTPNGVWYLAQSVSYAAPWYQKKIDYFKFDGSVTRLHNFGHRFLGYFRASYQYVPRDKVPLVDQMSAGGVGTVRGYAPDVMIIAKSGYQLNAEIYLPGGLLRI